MVANGNMQAPASSQGPASLTLQALRLRFLLALGLVAALTLAGQAVFQYQLSDYEGYARTIELVASRQRMLTVSMSRAAVGLLAEGDKALRAQSLQEFSAGLSQLLEMHQTLGQVQHGQGLVPGGPQIQQAWRELGQLLAQIYQGAEGLLQAARQDAPAPQLARQVRELFVLAERYQPAMEALAGMYAEEARAHTRILQGLSMTLAGLVLALLLLEALFIFRPIALRIRSDMFRLTDLAEEMRALSLKDGLTGIFNRRHFDEEMDREWRRAARENQVLALLMMDIDHFKAFNDHYGHQAGDQALKSVAFAAGRELRRPGDLLARYGGEEFVMVLPHTGLAGALLLAENIRRGVRDLAIPNSSAPSGPLLTVSLGVAVAQPAQAQGPEALVTEADQALYRAKQAGRNQVAGPLGSVPEDWS